MQDLVILVPDNDTRFAIESALQRSEALGIRPISFLVRKHPNRDGGVRSTGVDLLASERSQFAHALLVFDHEGSGAEQTPAAEIEQDLNGRLGALWGPLGKCLVIEPEVDIWMWGSDNMLAQTLRWTNALSIRAWLAQHGFAFEQSSKPARPKEALQRVCRELRLPRSSSVYGDIASAISLRRCTDPAFLRLRTQLCRWFPQNA